MNRVCEILGIEKPVVQGSMTWITSAELAAAVSNAGGMGILGFNAGQTEMTPDPIETAERMRAEIKKTRALTDKPFAVTYMMPMPGDVFGEPLLNVILEEGMKNIFVLGFGFDPAYEAGVIRGLKEKGLTVLYRAIDANVIGSKMIEEAGADIIVATGADEGGGVSGSNTVMGTFSVVPMIADAVNIPVMAAGGIVDKRTAKAAKALGAEGVYCGTVFIASKECRAAQACKDQIVNSKASDLLQFKDGGNIWRSLPTAAAKRAFDAHINGEGGEAVAKYMNEHGGLCAGQLFGDLENGVNCTSTAIDGIKAVRSCKEIVDDLTEGVEW
ncbi:MAG: nitronate monooxygenase [Peptococcaceae bacterium]|nr:nitronate monooxygenase [Peptococcaceae bacterium]